MASTTYSDLNSIHNPATGTSPPASWGDQVRDNLEHLARPPGCFVERTATVSVSNNTITAIEFTAADGRDTDNFHSTVTNSDRITIPSGLGGWYHMVGQVTFASNSTGRRLARWRVNGADALPVLAAAPDPGGSTVLQCTGELLLSAGDYLQLVVLQTSGGALNVTAAWAAARKVAEST